MRHEPTAAPAPLSTGLPPILPRRPRLLILGSLPGALSLAKREYYAHPRNAFWHIMARLCDIPKDASYQTRVAALKENGIALWDVLARARRQGSLDSAIERASEEPNPIADLLRNAPECRHVAVNGGRALAAFKRHILPVFSDEERAGFFLLSLPSTSPAYAAMALEEKVRLWKERLAL